MSKAKDANPSLPNGGARDSKSKKATSFPAGSGIPGAPDSASTAGKDVTNHEETRRDKQPKNWARKTGSKHSDEQAKKEQC